MATVIFKPTEACNARCIYCDVVHKKPRGPVTMPLETLEVFFSRINEFLLERKDEEMDVVWHGGEPLLLGPDYFEKALHFQEKYCSQTAGRIKHSIQSNLTLFSKDFTGIFKKLGIYTIGTSYEPVGNIRGLGAKRDSDAYNRRFMEAIRLIEEEGFSWGIIYVVTRMSLANPLEIFHFLSNISPRGGFMLNPVLLYHKRLEHLRITPEEYTDFLGAVFPVWWHNREEFAHVEPFASLTRNLLEKSEALICCDSGACAYSHIDLMPDGSVSHCGRSADWGLLNYGSIFEKSFSDVLDDPQRKVLVQRNTVLPKTECRGCRFWKICHGGCPLDGWAAGGSFLHKSEWCYAKRGFIEKYFEPITRNGRSIAAGTPHTQDAIPQARQRQKTAGQTKGRPAKAKVNDKGPIWIDPIGGLGDTLMISGVLKHVIEKDPSRKFNLIERTKYRQFLEGHPAIAHIGYPPPGARFIRTDYWDHEDYRLHGKRAYQTLARIFGLKTPVEERLYVPWEPEDDPALMKLIPWKQCNVLICQSSDSPRKQMGIEKWEALAAMMNKDGIGVIQTGKIKDSYVRGAYSLLGLTPPRQLICLVRHFDAVVTADNFIMHAAHLCSVPAVVLWGPTDHRIHGYAGHIHLQAKKGCDYPNGCLGPGQDNLYPTDCPKGREHCINTLPTDAIYNSIIGLLKNKKRRKVLNH